MKSHAHYLVRATIHRFAPSPNNTRYFGRYGADTAAPLVPFKSWLSARQAINQWCAEVYHLGHDECARPTLAVVRVKHAPRHIRAQVAYKNEVTK